MTADAVDPETGVSEHASDSALGDSGDDGVAEFDPLPTGRLMTVATDVAVSGAAAPSRLCGWVDFDSSGQFDLVERACVDVAAGATTVRLEWLGRPVTPGVGYVRLRIASDADQAAEPVGASDDGEIEDYPIAFVEPADPPRTKLSLTTTAEPGRVSRPGQPVTFGFVATNTGDVALTSVRISSELAGLGSLDCLPVQPAELAVGQSLSCRATRTTTQDDLDFGLISAVSEASGEAPDGDTDDDSDDVTAVGSVDVDVARRSALSLKASTSVASARSGSRVTITLVARNSGNLTLTAARLSTTLAGMTLTCDAGATAALAPDDELTCRGTYRVTAADARRGAVSGTGTVRAEAPYGDTAVSTDDVRARTAIRLRVSGATAPAPSGGEGERPDPLPATGGASTWVAAAGALLMLGGLSLIRLTRRRSAR